MSNIQKIIGGVVAILILAVVLGYATRTSAPVSTNDPIAGAAGNLLLEDYDGGYAKQNGGIFTNLAIKTAGSLQVGSSGTEQVNQVVTSCSMTANTSITATSTGYAFCTGITGLTSADEVQANFASSTVGATTVTDNWIIVSANASSSVAGAVDFLILNLTGASRAPSAVSKIGSSTSLVISH